MTIFLYRLPGKYSVDKENETGKLMKWYELTNIVK